MARINSGSTSKALFKNTGIIAIGQISTRLINFFLLPLYTAILSQEEYGLVDLLSTYSGFIAVIVGMQLSQAAFRFLVTCRDDEEKTTNVISTIAMATMVVSIIYALLFGLVSSFIHLECKWYLLVHVIVALYLQTTSCIARGLGRNADYAAGNFISAATSLILNVIAIAVLRLGVPAMLAAYIIGPVVGGTFLLFRSKEWRYIKIKKASKEEFNTIIKYALPLVPNELSWSVIHASDRMVISHFLSVAVNGLIAVAAKFSSIYTTVFSIFNTSWTEQVVLHYKDEGGPEYICDMFDKMVTFFGTVAIGIISSMPFLFNVFVNAKFNNAYPIIPFYMIAVFFNAIIGMISAIYLIENETKQVAISTAVAAAINLLVDLLLVRIIGAYAAPISSICGYATISFWRLYDVNKRHCHVAMPVKKVMILLLMLCISLVSYYLFHKALQLLFLIILLVLALLINKDFLSDIIVFIKKRIIKH
ncbi:MAG: oligosaccharide flippase family protein [Clostridia bacterium]|nr:oligosaccharide flippase family protein [Clostridia bacterium]